MSYADLFCIFPLKSGKNMFANKLNHDYERNNSMKKSKKTLPAGKGMAIAVVLGVAAVSVASFAAYSRTMSRLTPTDNDASSDVTWVFEADAEDDLPVNKPQQNVPKEPEVKQASEATAEAEEANKPVVIEARNIMPVEGEVSHPFSNGELVKSETLGVWKTHDGCDILCPLGTEIKSMSSGVVKEIREDALWGVCVIVEQENGLEVHYCGLAKELDIKTGQTVQEGGIIGKSGDTCQAEIVQEPHLHLAVKQGGKWIDPMSVITASE